MLFRTMAFAGALAIANSCTPAEGATLMSGFISKHNGGDYNERNNGIGLRIDSGAWAGWAVGTYRNSLDRQSVYVVREWQWGSGPVRVGVIAGAATGYNFPVMPAALPEVLLVAGPVELALIAQPLHLKDSPAFAAVQLRIRF